MSSFSFNKIYVIESLDSTKDKLTGQILYNDLLKWKALQIAQLESKLVLVKNKNEFESSLEEIHHECCQEKRIPIIHFEIHGNEAENGLVLSSGELVKWSELVVFLRKINFSIGNNLFVTLAVCQGAFLMSEIKSELPSPFWAIIGSFDNIKVSDLMIRYNEFYQEFFESFNINKAFKRLEESNPELPSSYRFINSEQTFKKIQMKYHNSKFSNAALNQRFAESIKENNISFKDPNEKARKKVWFKTEARKSKKHFFEKHKSIFFMLDEFPENKDRFPLRYDEVENES